ncbi:MAG: hypothetical protein SFU98_16955 [Leptospiraceae bacterium]|nr:hypothetical protein [Leptospiraceae bacterium]
MKIQKLILFLTISLVTSLVAEEKKWAVEAELIQPFIPTVQIGRIQATRTIWGDWNSAHGEFKVGAFIRPKIKHDVVDVIDEYAGSVGYRHFFNANWTVEANYYLGYVWGYNNKANQRNYTPFVLLAQDPLVKLYAYQQVEKDYQGTVQFVEALLGYRFLLNEEKTLYFLPQFGVFHGFNPHDIIGPRDGKPETFIVGNLLVGIRF